MPLKPTSSTTKLLILLYLLLSILWFASPTDPTPQTLAFLGWTFFLFLATTFAAILAGTASPTFRTLLLNWLLISLSAAALVALVALTSHVLPLAETFCTATLLAAWLALWTVLSHILRRLGPGISVGLSLTLAMFLTSSPITAVPLARSAGTRQPAVVQSIALASPLLATLDAERPALYINWPTLPGMYRLSGLGQDIPMELPHWWINALVYAGAAALVLGISRIPTNVRPRLNPGVS